jgi:hypothetical protein
VSRKHEDHSELEWDDEDEVVLSDRQQSMLNDEAVVIVGDNANAPGGYQYTSASTFSDPPSDGVTVAVVNVTGWCAFCSVQ